MTENMSETTSATPVVEAPPLPPSGNESVDRPQAAETPAAQSEDDLLRSIYRRSRPARDDGGKFAPRDPIAPPTDAPAAPVEEQAEAPPALAPPTKPMPASWSRANQELWSSLTPAAQEIVLKRESEMDEGVKKLKGQYEPLNQIKTAIEPHAPLLARMGLSPEQGVLRLINFHDSMMRDPYQGIVNVAQAYGVDLARLLAPQGQQGADGGRVERLEAELRALRQEREADKLRSAEATMQSLQSQVDAFKAKPEHKHFDRLRERMSRLLQSGEAENLKDAYDKAALLDAEIRAEMDAERREQEAAKARAEQAKKAAAINLRSSPPSAATPQSVDDELRSVYRRLNPR